MAENTPVQPARRGLWRLVDLLWLAALGVYVLLGMDLAPLHGDESMQLYMSHDYYYLVQQHDLDRVLYDPDLPTEPRAPWEEQQLRLMNGTVNKMLIGLSWDIAGLTVDDVNDPWDWTVRDPGTEGTGWAWNLVHGGMPGDRLLHAGRIPSTLLTVLSGWAVFGIAWLAAREVASGRADTRWARAAAYSASLIYATHPNVLLNGRRAMMEGSMMGFTALTVLAGGMLVIAQRRPDARQRTLWGWTISFGLLAGTALASKHTALLGVVPVYGVLLIGPPGAHWATPVNLRRMAVGGLLIALTFLAWNPAWWTLNPDLPLLVVEWRSDLLNDQTAAATVYDLAHTGLGDRVETLVNGLFETGPQYAEMSEWYDWLAHDIDEYEDSGLAGRLGGPVWAGLGLTLLVAGLICAARSWQAGAVFMVIAWGALVLFGLFGSTVAWERYYLLLQAPADVLAGLGAAWLLNGAARVVGWMISSARG